MTCLNIHIPSKYTAFTISLLYSFLEKRRAELSEEEKQKIVLSEEFQRFFDRSTRLVERALWEEPNLFVDYTGGYDGENGDGGDGDKAGIKLSLNRYFYDERWTKNRVVTSMDWSVRSFVKSATLDRNWQNVSFLKLQMNYIL